MRTDRRKMMMMINVVDMNVEYIMTNGKQYILTDWVPLTDTKIEMYFHAKYVLSEKHLKNIIFYSKGENNTIFSINNGAMSQETTKIYLWNDISYEAGGKINPIYIENYIHTKTPLLLYMSKDSCGYYQNNVFTNKQLELRTQPCTTPLNLFAVSDVTTCYNRAKLYIYGIRCWNNGILERDFVPAKRNGIYGLYDKVNKKFWRSSSGVDFLGKDK